MNLGLERAENADYIVVGCGFTGSVIARLLAEKLNKKILIIDRRNHIAGNMYDEIDSEGIRTQRYGIHVLHTDNEEVITFLERFSEFVPYKVYCLGWIEGKLLPIPFNFISIDRIYSEEKAQALKSALLNAFPGKRQVPIIDLLDSGEPLIKEYAEYLYKHDFLPYTAKQWGVLPQELDPSVISRVPIELSENCDYFHRKFQYMPNDGFSALFDTMLRDPNIDILLGCDIVNYLEFDGNMALLRIQDKTVCKPVIYTGPLDELFEYVYGRLPYRSLRFEYETVNVDYYQEAPFVAYPEDADYTRIIEFKHFTGLKPYGVTTIMREYPVAYQKGCTHDMEPYYPVPNEVNQNLFEKYKKMAGKYINLKTCGRLADYKYYYMYEAIIRAFEVFETIKKELKL